MRTMPCGFFGLSALGACSERRPLPSNRLWQGTGPREATTLAATIRLDYVPSSMTSSISLRRRRTGPRGCGTVMPPTSSNMQEPLYDHGCCCKQGLYLPSFAAGYDDAGSPRWEEQSDAPESWHYSVWPIALSVRPRRTLLMGSQPHEVKEPLERLRSNNGAMAYSQRGSKWSGPGTGSFSKRP